MIQTTNQGLYVIHGDTESASVVPSICLGSFLRSWARPRLWDHRGLSIQCLSPSCHQPGAKKTPILKKYEELVVESTLINIPTRQTSKSWFFPRPFCRLHASPGGTLGWSWLVCLPFASKWYSFLETNSLSDELQINSWNIISLYHKFRYRIT